MNPIDFNSFNSFCETIIGRELYSISGKLKFTVQTITNHAYHYQVSESKIIKQNIRYVQRVLDQYAKLQSLNPGHYANITPNGEYILALIQVYEKSEDQKLKNTGR
jgi:hypothetical protein